MGHRSKPVAAEALPPVLTAIEAAKLARVGRTKFYRMLADGDVPCARLVGDHWRIGRDALMNWLSGHEEE